MTMTRRRFVHATSATLGAMALGTRSTQDWQRLRVDGDRLNQHLDDLSQFGRTAEGGVHRVAFSDADIEARRFCLELMSRAGLDARIDAAGNVVGRRPGLLADAPPIVFGSHIDTVPDGGKYDGSLGSLSAIEIAETLRENGYRNRRPLEVVIFSDEESGLSGSSGFVGALSREALAGRRSNGPTLAECIERIGGDPARIEEAARHPGEIAGYIELHIEQGATLERAGIQIGVVEGIVGITRHDVVFAGFPNHAGTTPMSERRDAMLAAAELVLAVNRQVRAIPGRQVGTVGRLEAEPNAPNVIPGRVTLTVELRDLSNETIDRLWEGIAREAQEIAQRQGASVSHERTSRIEPALADPGIRGVIADAAADMGLSTLSLPSGAGHDAQELARIGPMGMLFVPSVGGVSHSPLEFTRPEDVVNGANVLLQSVLRLDRQ